MNESAGHQINPFFIHRYGDSDDDHWTTQGMSGMIRSRNNCIGIVKSNGGGEATMGGVKIPKRNAVGIIKWMKKKKKTKTTTFKRKYGGRPTASAHLRDFMHATSMHGLKYAAEKEATWIER